MDLQAGGAWSPGRLLLPSWWSPTVVLVLVVLVSVVVVVQVVVLIVVVVVGVVMIFKVVGALSLLGTKLGSLP